MQRYFISKEQFDGKRVRLTEDAAHHLIRVMRARAGERFICSNGVDREVLVQLSEIVEGSVFADIVEELPPENEPRVAVWIAQSLPKGDKLETVIQKCTEIGAAGLIPFVSARSVVRYNEKQQDHKLKRWRKIALEAAEQAHRNRIPPIEPICSWQDVLERIGQVDTALFCYERETETSLREAVRDALELSAGSAETVRLREGVTMGNAPHAEQNPDVGVLRTLLLVVGPEGGFTESEVAEATAAGGVCVGLGRRILRTETAAMVGLTCILYESGEMGG